MVGHGFEFSVPAGRVRGRDGGARRVAEGWASRNGLRSTVQMELPLAGNCFYGLALIFSFSGLGQTKGGRRRIRARWLAD